MLFSGGTQKCTLSTESFEAFDETLMRFRWMSRGGGGNQLHQHAGSQRWRERANETEFVVIARKLVRIERARLTAGLHVGILWG